MFILLHESETLFRSTTARLFICIMVTIAYSGCQHEKAQQGTPSTKSQTPQTTSHNISKGNNKKADAAQQKKECIQWLIKHKVLWDLFVTMDPDYEKNPIRWHAKYFDKCGGASLVDPTIRDEDIHYLSLIPNLRTIFLSTDTTKISDAGLKHLKSCPHLSGVNINGNRVIPPKWIETLASIDTIDVWCLLAPVNDNSVNTFHNSKTHIRDLFLANTSLLTEKGYRWLGLLSDLEDLSIMSLKSIGDAELGPITHCRKLQKLNVMVLQGSLDISSEMAEKLASLPVIQVLELDTPSTLSSDVLVALGKGTCKTITLNCTASRVRADKEDKNLMEVSREMINEATATASGNE